MMMNRDSSFFHSELMESKDTTAVATTAAKHQNSKFMKFLPRAASAVSFTFQNPPPFSPARDKRSHTGVGHSGPIFRMIPDEARHRSKNSSFIYQEPTSPKVSCMGQIKCKKQTKKTSKTPQPRRQPPPQTPPSAAAEESPVVKGKKKLGFKGKFFLGRKSDASNDRSKTPTLTENRSPCLSQMKRFASGRETLANFEWTKAMNQITPVENDNRSSFSEDEKAEENEDGNFYGAIYSENRDLVLQPKKEINLWKRRTVAQPKPLQLQNISL